MAANALSGAEAWRPYAARMASLCQACGSELAEDARACMACMRPAVSAFARPTLDEDEDAVEYECDDLEPKARRRVSDALAAAGIRFRWEPGLTLAVPEADESKVDAILDAGAEEDEEEDSGAVAEPEDALPAATEEWGAGEDAFSLLGDLYDAADRLFHAPTSPSASADLMEAAETVNGASPPYGFNGVLWQTAVDLADQLADLLTRGASNADIQAGAEALRDVLAEHV